MPINSPLILLPLTYSEGNLKDGGEKGFWQKLTQSQDEWLSPHSVLMVWNELPPWGSKAAALTIAPLSPNAATKRRVNVGSLLQN